MPTQSLTHLGLILDTYRFQVHLSLDRQSTLRASLLLAHRAHRMDIMALASLLGLMVSCQDILVWARFHLRPLQSLLRPYSNLVGRKRHLPIPFPCSLRKSLDWWLAPGRLSQGLSLDLPSRLIITTDASLLGWGAHLQDEWTQGRWSADEASRSINFLELRAIRLALLHFQGRVTGAHILVRMDNTTAKAYLNRQGGTRSRTLMGEASRLFQWAERHVLSIRAEHLAGIHNIAADWLSRQQVADTEWQLHPEVFHLVTEQLGDPLVDLFAMPNNTQLPRFFTRHLAPGAEGVDALQNPWPQGLLYAFPPSSYSPRFYRGSDIIRRTSS